MRNIKLTIMYDGKDFNGWQKQPNKLNIQGTIEKVISEMTGEEIELMLLVERMQEYIVLDKLQILKQIAKFQ